MTTPTIGSGKTNESSALRQINSRDQPFVNKDYVKNIAWLNNSVDTLSAFTQELQKGVEKSNEDILTQLSGFAADLFILFAGGEPTGIELGDLQYVIQAIGAFFGIDADTPFPINLLDAAQNMLENFFMMIPQFTDVIFDSIEAWAIDLGFDDGVVDAAENLQAAINDWGEGIFNLFAAFSDTLTGLLEMLGFGRPPAGVDWFTELISGIVDTLNAIIEGPRQALLYVLSILLEGIFNSLAFVLNITSPNNFFRVGKTDYIGTNLIPVQSSKTTDWLVGVNANTGWVYNTNFKSFDTNGTASSKDCGTVLNTACQAGKKVMLSGDLKWTGLNASTQFGIYIDWYTNDNKISRTTVDIPTGHALSGGWLPVSAELTVPSDINFFRAGVYVGTGIYQGTMSVRNLKVLAQQAQAGETLFSGITTFFDGFLGLFDPLNAAYLYGTPQQGFFDLVPAAAIAWTDTGNLLENPNFDADTAISGGSDWVLDPTTSHGTDEKDGSVKCTADGTDHELYSNPVAVVPNHALTLNCWVKWSALISTGASIKLMVAEFANEDDTNPMNLVVIDSFSVTGTHDWMNLDGIYHTPTGVNFIRMVMSVTSGATGGDVWFSDAMWVKNLVAGMMPKSWTDGLDDLNDSVEGWWGDFWDGVFGGNGSADKTATDAAIAAAAQAQTISGTTSQMIQILAALGRGNPDADDFERWDLFGIGTKWAAYSSAPGGLTISDAHNAQWVSSFDAEYVVYSDVKAKTHIQSATLVLGSAPEQKISQNLVGDNRIWLRATSFTSWAARKGLCAIFKADQTMELWWFNAGVGTRIFAPVPLPNLPVKGSILEFNAGTNSDLMHMTARFNGQIVLDDVDSTNISSYGDTQMRRGFGGFNDAGFLLNAACGKVKQFTAVG